MFKMPKSRTEISNHLLKKGKMIVITNACNLNCGGCCQLIGQFKKKQIWFIELEELKQNIEALKENKVITIFGGEPTLHPKWNEIVELLKSYSYIEFWINTNGRLGHKRYEKENNLVWWVDLHPESQLFVQTMYAAKDVIDLPNDIDYWEKAQKDCVIWKGCQSAIYKNKSYFCEHAAAIDWLFNEGKNGWELEPGKNPFDRTDEEINKQASESCKRCGWCVAEKIPRQLSKNPTYISPYNELASSKKSLLSIEPVNDNRWDQTINNLQKFNLGIYYQDQAQLEVQNDMVELHNFTPDLKSVQSKHDWTIILGKDQVIPNKALNSIINWIGKEKNRLHFSLPVYEMKKLDYDVFMNEPNLFAKNIIIAFHRNAKETNDVNLPFRLGHRNHNEGYGISSLWHDKLTSVVGGVIQFI